MEKGIHDFWFDMVVSQDQGPEFRPQNAIIPIIGIPKIVP